MVLPKVQYTNDRESAEQPAANGNLFRLDGKAALVTGAGGAIGQALCAGMALHGASVACLDLDSGKATDSANRVRQAGREALALELDVRDAATAETAVERTIEAFGRLDVLVNLAGQAVLKPAVDYTAADWEHMANVYLRSTFLFCKAAASRMIEQGSGSIINISSVASLVALGRGTAAYAAMKAGVNGLTRELALEWASKGVRVNAIAPCQVDTPQLRAMLEDPRFDSGKLMETWLSYIPMGRLGNPEELVGPCLFLASNASSLVTGHVLVVDGGYTIH